ncbi:hypothetical protein [Paenibacillus koleovorans]|uniref:hypothetical protein n=1 Tax=Paenibacillus koleovorans TaxID=121608 RepID=UPI0013E2A7EA|nr:hypothetical protein [Paenibacillus koleovorans]
MPIKPLHEEDADDEADRSISPSQLPKPVRLFSYLFFGLVLLAVGIGLVLSFVHP